MKTAFRLACFSLALAVASSHALAQAQSVRDLERSSRNFVQRFYDDLVDPNRRVPRFGAGTEFPIDPELERLLKQDTEEADAFPGEIAGLDFDPFAGGNEVAARYEVGRVERRGDRFLVDVYRNWTGKKKEERPEFAMELSHGGGRWTIMNMHYYAYEDGAPVRTTDLVSTLHLLREERRERAGSVQP